MNGHTRQERPFSLSDVWSIARLPDLRMEDTTGSGSNTAASGGTGVQQGTQQDSGASTATANGGDGAAVSNAQTPVQSVAGYDFANANSQGNSAGQDAGRSGIERIPEAYRQFEWAQNFAKTADPIGEVFKAYDNAQRLIGQRPPVNPPGADATAEQVKAWRKFVGVPDDASGYKFDAPKLEGDDAKLWEYISKEQPPEFIGKIAQKAHEIGLTPQQFKALAETYNAEYLNANKSTIAQMQQADAQLNADFETKASQALGERKDLVLKNGKAVLDKAIPADSPVRVYLNQFNNEQLVAVSMVAGMLYDRYEKEDGFGKGAGVSAANKAQIEAEITSLMSQDAFRNKMHGDHAKVNERINDLYRQMGLHGAVYRR